MATDLNTAKFEALATLTGVRTDINDMEWRWLSDITGLTSSTQDMWAYALSEADYSSQYEMLADVVGYESDINSMWLDYWTNYPGQGVGVIVRTLNLAGDELVTNGLMSGDITGWTNSSSAGGAIAYDTGTLATTNTSGTARARQTKTVGTGERYAAFVQRVGGDNVAGTVQFGNTAGGSQYLSKATNPAIATQVGIAEFDTTTTLLSFQMAQGVAGVSQWDYASLRKLSPADFPVGTTFEDDFSGYTDGLPFTLFRSPDGLLWHCIDPSGNGHTIPVLSGGKMSVEASAFSITPSYPYWDFGNGTVKGIHVDAQWSGDATLALISSEKTGSKLTVSNIVTNSVHILFSPTQVAVQKYVGGVQTGPAFSYDTPVVTDGRTYADVGWRVQGNVITVTCPGGQQIDVTDADLASVLGNCGVVEFYYETPSVGPLTVSRVEMELG